MHEESLLSLLLPAYVLGLELRLSRTSERSRCSR
jgi:hypothetical protein